jgi:hypothetical protein
MARDTLTGDPLVAFARWERGGILHSVPHWLQIPHTDRVTSVELLSLRSVPAFRSIGNSFPGITLGAFLAQRAMVELLLQGLATAFDHSEHAEHPRLERGK